jgi:hypothetical protein
VLANSYRLGELLGSICLRRLQGLRQLLGLVGFLRLLDGRLGGFVGSLAERLLHVVEFLHGLGRI